MPTLRNATLRWHILLIVLLSGIPGIAIVAYSTWVEESQLRAKAIEASTAAVHHMVLEHRKLRAQTEQLLMRLAAMPEFARGDYEACQRQISRLVDFSEPYASFGLATPEGEVVCSIVLPEERRNIADRPYFQVPIKTRDIYYGTYQLNRSTGAPSFPISAPIYRDKRLAGVAFAIVPAAWYTSLSQEARIPRGFTMTVLDRDLNVLARIPEDEWVGENISAQPVGLTLHGATVAGTAELPGFEDKPHFVAFAPLSGPRGKASGFVVVSAPKSQVFAEAEAALVRNIVALLFVIVAVIFAALYGADRLVLHYVRNLVDASRRLRSGDMTARVTESGGSSEIRVLGQTFNEMASALHERELALKEAQRLARVGSWEWSLENETAAWSEELYRIHGRDPQLPALSVDFLALCCVPESRKLLLEAVEKTRQTGMPYQLDLKTLEDRWITVRGEAVRDAAGRIVKLRGTSQDITARKQTEAMLLEKNRELADAVQELELAKEHTMRAEKSALDYAQRLRSLSRRIVELQESEQRSLARELHDSVSSSLAVVGLELHSIEEELPPEALEKVGPRLEDCIQLVKDIMGNARDISSDLHSAMLEHAGLAPALGDLAGKLEKRTRLVIDVAAPEQRQRVLARTEAALFRIAQEALTNCVKHAHASRAAVQLSFDDQSVMLSITDDGEGFDLEELAKGGLREGLGLLSMRERAEAIGGEFSVASAPGKGTKIVVRAPCRRPVNPDADYVI